MRACAALSGAARLTPALSFQSRPAPPDAAQTDGATPAAEAEELVNRAVRASGDACQCCARPAGARALRATCGGERR